MPASSSRRLRAAVFAAFVSSIAATVSPQVAIGRVLLATVVDAAAKPIVDLSVDDFAIEENGAAREVFSVHVADYPVVLLIDASARAVADRRAIHAAAARFLRRVGEERAVAVGTLSSPPTMLGAFGGARGDVLDRLERPIGEAPPVGDGPLAPLAAVAAAARMVQALGSPFSCVIVVWSPDPTRVPDGAATELSAVFESRTVLHVVSRGAAGQASTDDEALRDLSARTGGQFIRIYSEASYNVALDRLADRLGAEVMVEFLVPQGPRGDVRAGVRIPGARVQGIRISP